MIDLESCRKIVRSIVALAPERRGVALVEFAFCLPFLVLLYVGGYQLTDGISAYRKVTTATRTIADLTSQYTAVTDSDLDTILNASQQVMAPYAQENAKMMVSQISIDNNNKSTVDWSCGKNTIGLTPGDKFTIPTAIKQPNTSVIVAEIIYTYTPTVASSLIGTIPMEDNIIMSPRATVSIFHQSDANPSSCPQGAS